MENYEIFAKNIVNNFKNHYFENPIKYSIPILYNGGKIGRLRPIPNEIAGDAINDVSLQTKWRNLHKDSFLVESFVATDERTLKWLNDTYFNNSDRLIFMIEDINNYPIGHLGFENFVYAEQKCEYGRLMRGDVSPIEREKRVNLIELAQISFLNWGFNFLKLKLVYGTQFTDNELVSRLHAKCGFKTVKKYEFEKSTCNVMLSDVELKKENFKLMYYQY